MTVVAIIPARSGSAGIPNKNLITGPLLCGRPLLTWTVDAAAESCDVVLVSTDDEATLDYAHNHPSARVYGIRRPAHLCTATSPSEAAILHAIGTAPRRPDDDDAIVFMQLTSPLRTAAHVRELLRVWRETGADTAAHVEPAPGMHFCGRRRGDMYLPDRPMGPNPPRQQLGAIHRENGATYIAAAGWWRKHGVRVGGKVACSVMTRHESVDVDDPMDLVIAEAVIAGHFTDDRARSLTKLGQAALDYMLDTGECLFCSSETDHATERVIHDEDCQMLAFLDVHDHDRIAPEDRRKRS